ncbi:MAG TPA: lysophospholipid acyltransferase family protein [Gaiellaceae bacterium]|nr:lysophospholipid acyltransferase family protein [Gaiellaceae bacterium]
MKRPPLYTLFELIGFRHWFAWLYRVEIRNPERIPETGPVILVANHESLIDPWLLGLATLRPVRYMAKAELWRTPLLRQLMRLFGTFPIERGAGDRSAVGRAADLLEDGEVLGIFPQGTCLPYRDRPWLRGAARLALSTGTAIVPVCIVGSEKALRPGKVKLGLPRIKVLVGEPVEVERARPTVAAARALTATIEQAIEDARAPYGPPAHAWYPDERAA